MFAGFAALFALQQIHASPRLTGGLAKRLGRAGALIGLGALALAALALVLTGYSQASYAFVWLPGAGLRTLILPLMFVAFIFVAASVVPSNLRRLTRAPVLWGVVLWSIAHLLTKEHLAAISLFAGFGLLALVEIASRVRGGAARHTHKQPWIRESLTVAVGGMMFIVMFYAHGTLFNASPAMLSRPFG